MWRKSLSHRLIPVLGALVIVDFVAPNGNREKKIRELIWFESNVVTADGITSEKYKKIKAIDSILFAQDYSAILMTRQHIFPSFPLPKFMIILLKIKKQA